MKDQIENLRRLIDGIETIPPRNHSLPCPLGPDQQRLWFLEQMHPGLPVYNEAKAVRLRGEFDAGAIERALNIIVARHEMLRATIEVRDGQPAAVVRDSWPLEVKRIDLAALAPDRRQAEVDRLLIHEPRRLYHLETEAGIRATLLRLDDREHVFILMMHQIICDWSSEAVIWRELSALYRALSRGEPPELPSLPIEHGDYAVWQQKRITNGAFAADLAFWEQNLRGVPPLLELPADRPRPRVNSFRGARQRFRIDRRVVDAARELSRRERVSLFTVFAAALNILLYRYTGQQDILLGVELSDRDRPGLQSLIGFLVHTHVLRTVLSGDLTVRELLDGTKKGLLELYEHRAVPFDQVVSQVRADRNLSYSPLFQVLINWRQRDQQLPSIGMEGLEVESLLAETRTSKFDFTWMLTDGADDISLEIEYSTDLFEDDRIARLAGHYQTILGSAAHDPQQRVAELPLLTQPERQQLLVDWNRTELDYPRNLCLHELFEQQANRTPDADAIVFQDLRLSYRQLNTRANQLAHHLQKLGVGPEILVAVCLERSVEMVVGILGILKAGGAYVPMDPAYPRDRTAFILQDSNAQVVVTQERFVAELLQSNARPLCIDKLNTCDENVDNPRPGVKPENLSYVIFTSGSTGRPKGVAIEHRNAVAFTAWARAVFTQAELAAVLFSTSICFDLSVFELFVTLASGGKVILAKNALELPMLKAAREVTLINTVPSAIAELLRTGAVPSSVMTVNLAGEVLSAQLSDDIYHRTKATSVYDLYGPSESTTYSTFTRRTAHGRAVIGRPIANTTVYLLDEHLQAVPIGLPGEIHIGGEGVARGYLNRPELTAQKFIPDPFSAKPGAHLYRTGDLARYLPDGNIEFLGRKDNQVKLRGFRIEPGEIESVLAGHPAVRDVAVLAREDVPGDTRLIAYLTFQSGQRLSPMELRGLLAAKVPEYMVPSAFVTLDRFPLTPNGKADRNALPAPEVVKHEFSDSNVVAANPTEVALTSIWSDILGVKQVGIHDNFFELGGHSLLMVRLQSRIEKELGWRLPVAALFQAPTVAQCAKLIAQPGEAGLASNVATFISGGKGTPLFLLGDLGVSQRLAGHLRTERAVYGIEGPFEAELLEFEKTGRVTISMEQLAERCIREIRRVRPWGPYYLAGHCFGGVLALEIAQQLKTEGRQAALVGLLNSNRSAEAKPTFLPRKLRRSVYHLQQVFVQGPLYIPSKIHEFFSVRVFQPGFYWRVRFTDEILKRYAARSYHGAVVSLRSTKHPPQVGYSVSGKGWDELMLGRFYSEDIQCSYGDFIREPHIGDVARKLDEYLSRFDVEQPQVDVWFKEERRTLRSREPALAQ